MADLGLNRTARLIYDISPTLCRRFLDDDYNPDKDYTENRYLMNSWELVTARIFPLLTERMLRCFNGSDFTAADIIAGPKPVTVYLCISEDDLEAKEPVIRLIMETLMKQMKRYFDKAPGETASEKGCRNVLYLLDEAGNITLPSLPRDVATVQRRSGLHYNLTEAQLDTLNLDLGGSAAGDIVNVRGTTAITNVFAHAGDDRFYVSELANETLVTAQTTDFLEGNLDFIRGNLNLSAGTGRHRSTGLAGRFGFGRRRCGWLVRCGGFTGRPP